MRPPCKKRISANDKDILQMFITTSLLTIHHNDGLTPHYKNIFNKIHTEKYKHLKLKGSN